MDSVDQVKNWQVISVTAFVVMAVCYLFLISYRVRATVKEEKVMFDLLENDKNAIIDENDAADELQRALEKTVSRNPVYIKLIFS